MDPQLLAQAAKDANQVGLLTYLVVAITLFCGFIVVYVIYQNGKREERYAALVETHIVNLGTKIDLYKDTVKNQMVAVEEANRMVKNEHSLMTTSLQKISETLIELAAITKIMFNNEDTKKTHIG